MTKVQLNYHKDHLGSSTLITNESGEVVQRVEYLPYGEVFLERHGGDNHSMPHKFNGRSALRDAFEATWRKKELDRMHGLDWYDSSARFYDHVLGRFHQIDPLAEKYYAWSPYTYCLNNPIMKIDPDGRVVETVWDLANVGLDVISCVSNVKGSFIIKSS